MKKSALISAAIIAYCMLHTACCFSQGTAINKTGATADNSAMLDVSDTTKGILIPRMKKTNKLSISSPATGLMIYQTDDTTGFWYYNGAKWMQVTAPAGTGGSSGEKHIGELYGGGVIFYVDSTGHHGLICSMIDLSTSVAWTTSSYQSTTVPAPGALSDWDGQTNTSAIVSQAGAGTNYAAGLCDAYTNADYGTGVYSDWYLPSRCELILLWNIEVQKTLDTDGNPATTAISKDNYYWSSSERNGSNAWSYYFFDGSTVWYPKYGQLYVRAIRAF